MVRLTTISNILSGIGLAVLGFSLGVKYLLQSVGVTGSSWPFYLWIGGAALLGVVLIMSLLNTFTELTGFIHPEDKLISNMFVFLMAIGTVLVLGALDEGQPFQQQLFRIGSMIVIAYVFLFIFVFFAPTITQGEASGQVKEMTSRFMLVSLVLGAIMAALQLLLDTIWYSFSPMYASGALGVFAVAIVVIIVLVLGRKYEPVGQ
ncbi:MAG: hypothetical protein HXY34_03870 [Candidatus Thorarchaeota archaeon]|nr:hypothetical protein [Candidatus Thorarchaeota archaeon]